MSDRRLRSLRLAARSLTAKVALVCLILFVAPVLFYNLLEKADDEKDRLVLRAIQQEGRLIAEALFPHLRDFTPEETRDLSALLARIATEGRTVKVLFQPARNESGAGGFLLIATHPPSTSIPIEDQQEQIIQTGILGKLDEACDQGRTLAMPFTSASGREEILTFLRTQAMNDGCWAVITSIARNEFLNVPIDRPYWRSQELQLVAAIYLAVTFLIISILLTMRKNLRRFRKAMESIRRGHGDQVSFKSRNVIPELSRITGEFDELLRSMRRSELLARQAAEENAHAFKAPLAVISQSLEPLRQAIPADSPPQRSIQRIEKSIDRLDGLISAARSIEQSMPALLDDPLDVIDLSRMLASLLTEYRTRAALGERQLVYDIPDKLFVRARGDLVETAVENVLDNALDFSPAQGRISVHAVKAGDGGISIHIRDEGPGIPSADLERVFDRYFSSRAADGRAGNFGIGLWIVRRNMEAMGGDARARVRDDGGTEIILSLRATPG
ncbi:sensor histidine kinase [Marivibrio halodurans]|uniref:histidine kinase n=1 Tax=Marivibrio halodurans TaxID=2039722 RepID=A0A8J7S4E6_9PROT|nr:ATP-binding protein [Marivibrio halodurans]MBP5858569.1 sensor histidine kinase [Marivibrio halodurans]